MSEKKNHNWQWVHILKKHSSLNHSDKKKDWLSWYCIIKIKNLKPGSSELDNISSVENDD